MSVSTVGSFLLTLFLTVTAIGAFAQKSESFLLGSWKTVDVIVPKGSGAEDVKMLKVLKPYMLKTTFRFEADHKGTCVMVLPGPAQSSKPSSAIYWAYSAENRKLSIMERKDSNSKVAEFIVTAENGEVSLALTDGPMVLKIKKVE